MPATTRKYGREGRLRSALIEALLWLFLKPLELLFGNLSQRAIGRWASCLYWIGWPFFHGMRKVARANLAIALPERSEKERAATAAASIRHVICIALEWIHCLHRPEDHDKLLNIPAEIRQVFADARAASPDHIVMGLTAHIGNWELFSHVEHVTGHRGAVITASFSEPAFDKLAGRLRTTDDNTVLIPARGAAFGLVKAVQEKLDLGMLIDQNVSVRRGGVFMPFFGLPAATSKLAATVAGKARMPMMVFGCIRQADGNYRMEYEPLEKPSGEYGDDYEASCAILRAYERLIRRFPEQYLWSYRRWREVPRDADEETARRFPYYARRA